MLRNLEARLRRIRRGLSPFVYAGRAVYCPICRCTYRKFRAAGRADTRRLNAVCPRCTARERDRFLCCYLELHGAGLACRTMLHLAPETSLERVLDELTAERRITGDLVRRDVDIRLDIQELPFSDGSFGGIYCGHVLQQVPNETKALSECMRVLQSGGWLLVLLPELPSGEIRLERIRKRRSSADAPPQVRTYTAAIRAQLEKLGSKVTRLDVNELLTVNERRRLAVDATTCGLVYLVRK